VNCKQEAQADGQEHEAGAAPIDGSSFAVLAFCHQKNYAVCRTDYFLDFMLNFAEADSLRLPHSNRECHCTRTIQYTLHLPLSLKALA
jgi:hypothetical protein